MQKSAKFLNQNFDSNIESTILLCKPLADWFARNQETMAYFELTKPGCLHFEGTNAHPDIIALGRMTNAGLLWLASYNKQYTEEEKAFNAAFSIANVYEQEKSKLSDNAKNQYAINIKELEEKETHYKSR